MRELEAEAGSLALAAIKRMLRGQQPGENPPPSRFITFKNGAQMLVDALVKGLKGDLKLNARVTGLTRDGGGYQVVLSNGETVYAHKVIFATLANVTAEILRAYFPEASENLGEIPHNHIGTISLVYRKHDLPSVPVINGLMIPRREGRAIDAVTFTSRKMPSRGSAGYELIRVFLGGGQPEVVEMGDEELIRVVRGELAALLGITASPLQISIFRWKEGFPQAEVGHLDLVDEIERILPEDLAIAGSSYRGIAVPDCIRQGREAAKKLVHP
jgi:oxygen-dependent protoporphyrinogen oxidase